MFFFHQVVTRERPQPGKEGQDVLGGELGGDFLDTAGALIQELDPDRVPPEDDELPLRRCDLHAHPGVPSVRDRAGEVDRAVDERLVGVLGELHDELVVGPVGLLDPLEGHAPGWSRKQQAYPEEQQTTLPCPVHMTVPAPFAVCPLYPTVR